jgi:hypothetical protein
MTFFGIFFHSLNTFEHHDHNSEIKKKFNIWLCELLKDLSNVIVLLINLFRRIKDETTKYHFYENFFFLRDKTKRRPLVVNHVALGQGFEMRHLSLLSFTPNPPLGNIFGPFWFPPMTIIGNYLLIWNRSKY